MKKSKSNYVTSAQGPVNQQIGDDEIQLQVISQQLLQDKSLKTGILPVSHPVARRFLEALPSGAEVVAAPESNKAVSENMVLGFPISLIGEQSVFGGVITKVSAKDNEALGILKLTDLTPVHVKPIIGKFDDGTPNLTLVGCVQKCEEGSQQLPLLPIPIVGVDMQKELIMLDLAAIGQALDYVSMIDPQGDYTRLKPIGSATTAMDFSGSTLVFDVKTRMIPLDAASEAGAPVTEFTVRWYLKLMSIFNPAFTPRPATAGVGYFTTERAKDTKITRFSTTNNGGAVKYYIKNVPTEYRGHFAKAFDAWNKEFKQIVGRELLEYEFVEASDPRHARLIPGDIRYNILEWDLENLAPYGGLGPSIANQFTGEIFSANVLIQGPTIVSLYTRWFEISEQARELRARGLAQEANELLRDFNLQAAATIARRSAPTVGIKLGKHLSLNVHGQRAKLEDPILKGHFEIVPAGMTYEQYMEGYFIEMVAHELGHNLGLRHNFKGNLGADESTHRHVVSRSVMEYLGRSYRHLNTIGEYDRMAIAYGYKGSAPQALNWFCTDEDQGSDLLTLILKSPECTKSDATSDPFSYWEGRLARTLDLLLERRSNRAPVWKASELAAQIDDLTTGFSGYAVSALRTGDTWTNFFGKPGRPERKQDVRAYVNNRIKAQLCDPMLTVIIAAKETAEARELAQKNLSDLRKMILDKAKEYNSFRAEHLSCN